MKKVKIAIVGVGSMGSAHAKTLNDIPEAELVAVCDIDKKQADKVGKDTDCKVFYNHRDLLKAKVCDAVLIATPHYPHTTIGIDVLKAKLHLLVEKPISVHKKDCERLINAYRGKKQVFSAMFNQRTDPHYRKAKELIDNGELGKITRINWIITNWFRTQAYYDNGGWRATWKGEGGGVLLNQCPHQLDLLQWLCGMPSKVSAQCAIGKYHKIEVEDEVTAYLDYPNGATGIFITSTGEAPGTNRLEITGSRGKLVVEEGKIKFTRNEINCDKFCKTTKESFATPGIWNIEIPVNGNGGQHREIMENFCRAILHGEKLLAPAVEGINSVELGNAMLFSSLNGKPVELPLNSTAYERALKKLIRDSKFVKKAKKSKSQDLSSSF